MGCWSGRGHYVHVKTICTPWVWYVSSACTERTPKNGTTPKKLVTIFQVIFNLSFTPKIRVSSIFERDFVHKVIDYGIKWRYLSFSSSWKISFWYCKMLWLLVVVNVPIIIYSRFSDKHSQVSTACSKSIGNASPSHALCLAVISTVWGFLPLAVRRDMAVLL